MSHMHTSHAAPPPTGVHQVLQLWVLLRDHLARLWHDLGPVVIAGRRRGEQGGAGLSRGGTGGAQRERRAAPLRTLRGAGRWTAVAGPREALGWFQRASCNHWIRLLQIAMCRGSEFEAVSACAYSVFGE
jgi:hypothetical protein